MNSKSKKKEENLQRRREEKSKIEEIEQTRECTFQPKITPHPFIAENTSTVEERNKVWNEIKEAKILRTREQENEEFNHKYNFKPALSVY